MTEGHASGPRESYYSVRLTRGSSSGGIPYQVLKTDKEAWIRERTAMALEQIADSRVTEPYLQKLTDEVGIIRKATVQALAELGNVIVVPSLIRVLHDAVH